MINLYIKNGNYSLAITLPSDYLREELHYADVSFNTPVSAKIPTLCIMTAISVIVSSLWIS